MTKKGKKDSGKYFDIDYLRSLNISELNFLSVLVIDNKLIEKVLKEKNMDL